MGNCGGEIRLVGGGDSVFFHFMSVKLWGYNACPGRKVDRAAGVRGPAARVVGGSNPWPYFSEVPHQIHRAPGEACAECSEDELVAFV